MHRPIRQAPLLLAMLGLSAPLLAHPPGMHPGMAMRGDMFATMDADHDGRVSAREHAAAAQAMFAQADANHDGYVTLDEMRAMHGQGAGHGAMPAARAAMQAAGHDHDAPTTGAATAVPAMPMDHDGPMPANGGMHHDMGMGDHFKAMDADGDGRISASEHAAGAARMFASMDADHDGVLSRAEFDAGHAAMMHGAMDHAGMAHAGMGCPGMDHAGMFKSMDGNGDGRVSSSEHAAAAAKMFTSMDANHDGSLSQAEFDAAHAAMMPGGMGHPGMAPGGPPAGLDDHAGHP